MTELPREPPSHTADVVTDSDITELNTVANSQTQYLSASSEVIWNDPVNFLHRRMNAIIINTFIDKPYQPNDAFHFPVTNGVSSCHRGAKALCQMEQQWQGNG